MCQTIKESTTKEDMKQDLIDIRFNLFNLSNDNPKIYKAIEPFVLHLIDHLEKVHEWIDAGKSTGLPKTDRNLEKEAHKKWFDSHYIPRYKYDDEKFRTSETAWLIAKGYPVWNGK